MFYIGLDLGQKVDFSAVAIAESEDPWHAWIPPTWDGLMIRYLYRFPIGTSYPGVVETIRSFTRSRRLWRRCSLVVDATGVGAPVVDLLREADLECELVPVTITGGDRARAQSGWNYVPKAELVTNLQVMLEKGRLKIARDMKETGNLVKELCAMRSMPKESRGRVRFGAGGVGEHDDLVMAVALACWGAQRPVNRMGTRRLL